MAQSPFMCHPVRRSPTFQKFWIESVNAMAGGPYPSTYDSKPWNACTVIEMADEHWWRREIEELARLRGVALEKLQQATQEVKLFGELLRLAKTFHAPKAGADARIDDRSRTNVERPAINLEGWFQHAVVGNVSVAGKPAKVHSRHLSSLVSSGQVDEPDAETPGMFHGEQQRSNRSKKIVAR